MSGIVLEHPPADHVLRQLGLELDVRDDGTVHGHLAVGGSLLGPSGEPRLGAVATAVDMVGGVASLRACTPDRVATADMALHLLPLDRCERLDIAMHVRRRGRRTLVMEAELVDERGRPAGVGTLSFAVLPQPAGAPVLGPFPVGRRPAMEPPVEPAGPFVATAGVRTTAPGVAEVEVVPIVRNSLGALNGGILTTCIDEAVASAAATHFGAPAVTTDVHIAFLELGRVGPVRARATLTAAPVDLAAGRVTADVVVTDEGRDGEVLTRATAVAVRAVEAVRAVTA